MACLLSAALLLLFSSHVQAAFYVFPDEYRLVFPTRTDNSTGNIAANVASLQACATLAAAKLSSGGFATYDTTAKTCEYATTINGYILGNSTGKSVAIEGTDLGDPKPLTPVQTEQYIVEKVYGNAECPPTTTLNRTVGFCTAVMPNIRWGNYMAGRDAKNTIYVLTKSKVIESLCYQCATEYSIKMTFTNQWFCYSTHPVAKPTVATISGNACKNIVPGSTVVKLTDRVKECGFLSNIRNVQTAYLGIFLPAGAKKSATAFKYYDNAVVNPALTDNYDDFDDQQNHYHNARHNDDYL